MFIEKNTAERRLKILEWLEKNRTAGTQELCAAFGVSAPTIRGDLRSLEKKGELIRSRGGCFLPPLPTVPLEDAADENDTTTLIKKRIGEKAATLVKDDDFLIIDSGSTTLAFTTYLSEKKNLVVLTNGIRTAYCLSLNKHLKSLYMVGGEVSLSSFSARSSLHELEFLKHMRFDYFFVGAGGFSLEDGISTFNSKEAVLNKEQAKISKKVIALFDSSKIGKKGLYKILPTHQIDIVITDTNAPKDFLEGLAKEGITTYTVEAGAS